MTSESESVACYLDLSCFGQITVFAVDLVINEFTHDAFSCHKITFFLVTSTESLSVFMVV